MSETNQIPAPTSPPTDAPVPSKPPFSKGLAGVVAAQTTISHPDGPISKLIYRGIDIAELAEFATYEEVAHLLIKGTLPTKAELKEFTAHLVGNREIPKSVYKFLQGLPKTAVPMEALRTAVSLLSFYDPEIEDISTSATIRKAIRLTAQFPTINAAFHRFRTGAKPIKSKRNLGHAANALYLLNGVVPDSDFAAGMNAYMVLLADHSLNASTFTARVVASTQADLHSSIVAAIGALKGPLHGGANEATMNTLLEIGEPDKVDAWVDQAFATKRIIMGFGHRIYKNGDPRARVLNHLAEKQGEKVGAVKYFHMSQMLEKGVQRHRELYPNVDFYSASLLYNLGIPIDLMTPYFAAARIAGWSAHVLEQYKDAALIRPASEYIGERDVHFVKLARRK